MNIRNLVQLFHLLLYQNADIVISLTMSLEDKVEFH